MPSDPRDVIQQIVEEASTSTGKGAQFLPILVIIEVVAALATIWGECIRKKEAAAMIQRACSHPWSVASSRVRMRIYEALPIEYKSPEFVEEVIRVASAKLGQGKIDF